MSKVNPLDANSYISQHLCAQQRHHSTAAGRYKWRYYCLSLLQMITIPATPLVPVLAMTTPYLSADQGNLITAIMGAIASLVTALQFGYRPKEQWIVARNVSEALKSIMRRYLTETAPFNGDQRLQILVDQTEAVLGQGHRLWAQHVLISEADPNKTT